MVPIATIAGRCEPPTLSMGIRTVSPLLLRSMLVVIVVMAISKLTERVFGCPQCLLLNEQICAIYGERMYSLCRALQRVRARNEGDWDRWRWPDGYVLW